MPCYHPLTAWRSKRTNENGKRMPVFDIALGFSDMRLTLPCGRCIGCRLERSRQWAMRCVHEAKQYERNCFITLTYDPAHLPADGSLHFEHFQKFMKRLRKCFEDRRIRFFHCGEYGEQFARPHYHAILFNHDFDDKVYVRTKNGNRLWHSDVLDKLWGFGYCSVGAVTFESAAYVARYVVKKVNGPKAEEYYGSKAPEYATMSRRPGIGMRWLERYGSEAYRSDFVVFRGLKMKPPRAYERVFPGKAYGPPTEEEYMRRCILSYVKSERKKQGDAHPENSTPSRLAVREEVKLARALALKREVENGP